MDVINLTPKSIQALDDLAGTVNISTLNRNLRNFLIENLIIELEEQTRDFSLFADDMKYLFQFLDVLEDDKQKKFEAED